MNSHKTKNIALKKSAYMYKETKTTFLEKETRSKSNKLCLTLIYDSGSGI